MDTTPADEATVPVDEQSTPARPGPVAAAADRVWAALAGAFSEWDAICALGLVMLLSGLWAWVGFGAAFTTVGAVVLVLGIAGGRAAAAADPVDELAARNALVEG